MSSVLPDDLDYADVRWAYGLDWYDTLSIHNVRSRSPI